MAYQIDVQFEGAILEQVDDLLETAITIALRKNEISAVALTVLLTDDARMRQLNKDFRGLDKSTDVLSFPAGDTPVEIIEELPYLGDIAISVPIARNQAQTSGHSLAAELQLLAVHGVLHLLGFDHLLPEEKAQMWSIQDEVLVTLGLHNISPSEI